MYRTLRSISRINQHSENGRAEDKIDITECVGKMQVREGAGYV